VDLELISKLSLESMLINEYPLLARAQLKSNVYKTFAALQGLLSSPNSLRASPQLEQDELACIDPGRDSPQSNLTIHGFQL
jgi:hypothetical protein